jgi:hypothetical protein
MMRVAATTFAAVLLAGCATGPAPETSTVVRSRAPAHVQSTITSYFDLTMPNSPPDRKLVFGAAEAADCAITSSGGAHLGWVVPVIYDVTGRTGTTQAPARKATGSGSGSDPIALSDVSISGTRYFFWFSNDTLSAVTRRANECP